MPPPRASRQVVFIRGDLGRPRHVLFEHGRGSRRPSRRPRALRPYAEKLITHAKKGVAQPA